ncbi:hypothetical protein C8R44DRAFT_886718 [Mycena epipterygia]|nr:hypothetical protein C8R44DRAFT_886718 [Mycena epipterygia]
MDSRNERLRRLNSANHPPFNPLNYAPEGDPWADGGTFNAAGSGLGDRLCYGGGLGHGPLPTRFAHRNDFRSASMDSPHRSVQPTHYHAPTFGDNSTPTPMTRYGRPAHYQPPTSMLPPPLMEHSQSDLLQGIHGMLQGLVKRVSALEVTVANATLASTPTRGLPAQRGRITNAKHQRILRSRNAGPSTCSQHDSCENIDPALLSEEDATIDNGQETTMDAESDASSMCSNVDLDKKEQGVLQQGFVTDIHENPITGQVYPIPRFQHRVDKEYNKVLCVSVAEQAARELRDGSDPDWNFVHLIHCSKEAFHNLKHGWKCYQTPELVAKKASADRRLKRREEKSIQSETVAAKIAQDFKLTQCFVRDVAHAEYQSDEVSGPDSDSGESKEAWKVRLLDNAGYPTDHTSVSCYNVLEVLIPGWRVENYGKLLRELRRRNSGKRAQKYLCIYTDRVSTRIPRYAPYNSAIDQAWLEEKKTNPENATLLADWNSYPEPDRCTFDLDIPDAQ